MEEISTDFYNCYMYKISYIRSIKDKNIVLSEMQETFADAVRSYPTCRNELSWIYQELKIRCEEVALHGRNNIKTENKARAAFS